MYARAFSLVQKETMLRVECGITFNSDSNREIGNVVVERNSKLRCTHYMLKDRGEAVEIYISDELKEMGIGFKKIKELTVFEIERVNSDPFGTTNIDPRVQTSLVRGNPAINRLSFKTQTLLGLPVAIKSMPLSTSIDENLIEQYLFMRQIQLRAEVVLEDNQKEILEFLPVYGVVKIGDQSFLLMKQVEGATEVEEIIVPFLSHGWMGSGDPYTESAISRTKYADLFEVLRMGCFDGLVRCRHIRENLQNMLGVKLGDIAGRNILFTKIEGGKRKYYILDQVPFGTYGAF